VLRTSGNQIGKGNPPCQTGGISRKFLHKDYASSFFRVRTYIAVISNNAAPAATKIPPMDFSPVCGDPDVTVVAVVLVVVSVVAVVAISVTAPAVPDP